jgi:TPP-dependent pyruvate/acetoin dehydrogenase alpha subunit
LFRIRRFEETVLEEFRRGIFAGTTHTCLGQEANAVGVVGQLGADDVIVSSHRCHGHFLAYGGSPLALFQELMGKPGGVCAGRGGSQHLHWRNFYSNGIQGGIAPLATGMALAEKISGSGALVVVFLGDGTFGEGVVYEALNFAALWQAPVFFVVENNHIAQTTPTRLTLSGTLPARFAAFNIPCLELDTPDVMTISAAARDELAAVRSGGGPRALVLDTARLGPHSKGDDTRTEEELALLRSRRDPLTLQAARLAPRVRARIESEITAEIALALQKALEA